MSYYDIINTPENRRMDFIMSVVGAAFGSFLALCGIAMGVFAVCVGMPVILAAIITGPYTAWVIVKVVHAIDDCKYDHEMWARVR